MVGASSRGRTKKMTILKRMLEIVLLLVAMVLVAGLDSLPRLIWG